MTHAPFILTLKTSRKREQPLVRYIHIHTFYRIELNFLLELELENERVNNN